MSQERQVSDNALFRKRVLSRSAVETNLYRTVGILIGFGPWRPLSILLLAMVVVYGLMRGSSLKVGGMVFFQSTLLLSFLLFYYVFYNPTIGSSDADASLFLYNYFIVSLYSVIALFMACVTRSFDESIRFLYYVSLGMLLYSGVVVAATVATIPPPYYGRLFNPLNGQFVNSPGYSNMALFFPAMVLVVLRTKVRYQVSLPIAALWVFCSLVIGVLLVGRSYFVGLAICVVLYLVDAIKSRYFVHFLLALCLLVFGDFMATNSIEVYRISREEITYRFVDQGLESTRWEAYSGWLTQITHNPFGYPVPSHSNWFHNFWMDVYAESGPVVFLLSILIFVPPMVLVFKTAFQQARSATISLLLLVPLFIIMATSIPMGGEVRALFFYFACSIVIIRHEARVRPPPGRGIRTGMGSQDTRSAIP